MTAPDDYPDDMKFFSRLTDRDIDRLLDGRAPESAEDLDDLARHLGGLKRAEAHVPEDVAARQVAQIVHTSQRLRDAGSPAPAASLGTRRRGRSVQKRLALLTAKVGAVFVGASMLTVGMAFAGVTLPQAVTDAAAKAGITLPNQEAADALANAQGQPEDLPGQPEIEGEGSETSAAVLSVIDTWTGERDCFFGLAVASAATGEEQDTSPCTASENQLGGAEGSKATGDEKSAEGRSKATTAGGNASTEAEGSRETGSTASDAKGGNAPTSGEGGQGTGEEASGGAPSSGEEGQQKGSEASEKGQSNRPGE